MPQLVVQWHKVLLALGAPGAPDSKVTSWERQEYLHESLLASGGDLAITGFSLFDVLGFPLAGCVIDYVNPALVVLELNGIRISALQAAGCCTLH